MSDTHIDLREFQQALQQAAAKTSRQLDVFVNSRMYHVVKTTHQLTPVANRQEIEQSLRIEGYKISRSRKTGKYKRGKLLAGQNSLAARIVNARRVKANRGKIWGKELEDAARSLVTKRIRGIGSEKAGWLASLKTLAAKLGLSGGGTGPRVKGKGKAIAAKPGWSPKVEIIYDLNSYDTNHRQYIDPRTVGAFKLGFAAEESNMRERLARKLQPIFDQHKGRA